MLFFQSFPQVSYTLVEGSNNSNITRNIPNMTIKLVMDILENPLMPYSSYKISDGDRPDTVAAKLYGASRYAWIIMLANNMRDWYDWPLSDSEFYDYMNRKYESVAGANDGYNNSKTLVDKYIWITSSDDELEVDLTFYNTLQVFERKIVTVYDTEYRLNDARRDIRVPTLSSVDQLSSRLFSLLAQ